MIIASFTTSVMGFALGFGLLAGAGIGMGYAAATPAAVKWFAAHRTGLIAGLVVAGFGLAPVYIAPLGQYLIAHFASATSRGPGVQMTMFILGIAFLIIVGVLSQLLAVPPAGWKPANPPATKAGPPKAAIDMAWTAMLATPQFYIMWLMYAFAAGAGLMIIANLASIVKLQAASDQGPLIVACMAVGNALGRVIAGTVSDKIGRKATMLVFFLFQAVLMFLMPFASAVWMFVGLSMLLGANYGANLALFPAATKDYFGLKNFGVNYGWVFTAWGVGGLVLAQISGFVFDSSKAAHLAELMEQGMPADMAGRMAMGDYVLAYVIAGMCLLVAALLLSLLRAPAAAPVKEAAPTLAAAK
jgi:MFS family permease